MVPLLRPDWPAPPGIGAGMSTRHGGVSAAPWASLNLGLSVADDLAAVAENRRRFAAALGARPAWLHLVHGCQVLRLDGRHAAAALPPADAGWTSERGLACTVTAADCMPVLFALRDGAAVAAAHAGWRGLAGGVLQATLQALCDGMGAVPADVMAWLGPCIGPRQFEVGEDVLRAFGSTPANADPQRFAPRGVGRPADAAPRWLANLPLLAHDRLLAAGVRHIHHADACTVEDASNFFSFRRDGRTGRMAAAIWRS